MKTFAEFLNEHPVGLKKAWNDLEMSWDAFLHELHDHLRDNMAKYDTHHAKFGDLSAEHPDQHLDQIVREVEKKFKKMKEGLSRLGAHEMI